jgi:hypothetical protein
MTRIVNKCETKWCRRRHPEDDGLCSVCRETFELSRPSQDDRVLFVYHCMLCPFSVEVRMSQRQRDIVVASGKLRCCNCKSAGAALTPADWLAAGEQRNGYRRAPAVVAFKAIPAF